MSRACRPAGQWCFLVFLPCWVVAAADGVAEADVAAVAGALADWAAPPPPWPAAPAVIVAMKAPTLLPLPPLPRVLKAFVESLTHTVLGSTPSFLATLIDTLESLATAAEAAAEADAA